MAGEIRHEPGVRGNGTVYTCDFTRTTPVGYKVRAIWNTTGSSSYSVPSGYSEYRDLSGNIIPVSGATITIGTSPILLESAKAF